MIAIITKYHGPTNTRGSRISATVRDDGGWNRRVSVPYPHEKHHGEETHKVAAVAMCDKLTAEGFTYTKPEYLVAGSHTGGYIFVFTDEALRD